MLESDTLSLLVRVHKVSLERLPAVLVVFWLHLLALLETPLGDADHEAARLLSISGTKLRK
jgi:hypothetical protein